jgi:protoheme IX farnesyltransferase
MKTATAAAVCPSEPALVRVLADYVELAKPRIAVLVLFTVAAGALMAGGGLADWKLLLHVIFGTALLAAGGSALNQFLERHSDALMQRTANRPLPAGRLQPAQVLFFGAALSVFGLAYLAVAVPHPLTALVALATLLGYVFVYTPLKQFTWLNTLVGAVPGALPPVIGWTAVRGTLEPEALILFAILFLWQLPHFLAIAWIYRDDYTRAGLQMLPVVDPDGRRTARHMVGFCLALLVASVLPAVTGSLGLLYLSGALVLGLGLFGTTIRFARTHSEADARRVLWASLVYLPVLLALLLLDGTLR